MNGTPKLTHTLALRPPQRQKARQELGSDPLDSQLLMSKIELSFGVRLHRFKSQLFHLPLKKS